LQVPDTDEAKSVTSTAKGREKWSAAESVSLIRVFTEMRNDYENPKMTKKVFWNKVTTELGLPFSSEQCQGRWKTMSNSWKRVEDHNRISGNSAKTYEFGEEMSAAVGGKSNVNPEHLLESSKASTEGQSKKFSKEILNSRKEPAEDKDADANDEEQDLDGKPKKKKPKVVSIVFCLMISYCN